MTISSLQCHRAQAAHQSPSCSFSKQLSHLPQLTGKIQTMRGWDRGCRDAAESTKVLIPPPQEGQGDNWCFAAKRASGCTDLEDALKSTSSKVCSRHWAGSWQLHVALDSPSKQLLPAWLPGTGVWTKSSTLKAVRKGRGEARSWDFSRRCSTVRELPQQQDTRMKHIQHVPSTDSPCPHPCPLPTPDASARTGA